MVDELWEFSAHSGQEPTSGVWLAGISPVLRFALRSVDSVF